MIKTIVINACGMQEGNAFGLGCVPTIRILLYSYRSVEKNQMQV